MNVYLDNGNIQREFSLADLENRLGWGFSLTWLHTSQINQAWGVEWGIKVGALPWRYYYEITKGGVANFPFNDLNYGTEYVQYIQVPLQLVFRKPVKQTLYFNLYSGISLRYILLQELTVSVTAIDQTSQFIPIFDSYSSFDNTPRTNFNLGTGISWVLPHFDMLDFQLMANISPNNYIFTDYYFFPGTAYETFGRYKSKGTYIGLSVGYTFTGVRKMLKRYRS
ncbi:MAG: hypothetical protein NW226_20790 [Microscillaceae bacterium]|nr:hypothetical protein [Microscillaceae bacterium]